MTNNLILERRALSHMLEQRCMQLALRVICPYFLVEDMGCSIEFSGFLPDFGSPRGLLIDVVVGPDYTPSEVHKHLAEKVGIPIAFVNPDSWRVDAGEFEATLRDWGYFAQQDN